MIPWLRHDDPFPPAEQALAEPNGLLAVGGDLQPDRLLAAYRQGIFPWYNPGEPILWWSPDPRMVLFPEAFKLSRSLKKTLRHADYEVRVDCCFQEVMQACAAPRRNQQGTWITREMIAAYTRLHRMGYAHSVEVWSGGQLAGGLYGVAIGGMFYGESMFSRVRDASKIALAHLTEQLRRWQFGMIDCQMATAHLASLGAREIPRQEFVRRVAVLTGQSSLPGPWAFEHDLFT